MSNIYFYHIVLESGHFSYEENKNHIFYELEVCCIYCTYMDIKI